MEGARERILRARSVAVLTGAGVSAESGVPTFRGEGGLWRRYRAEDLATPEAFARNPRLVWEWYDWRRQLIARCRPNAAHEAIAHLERAVPEFLLITQNIDGLHRQAGSSRLVELHGNIWRTRCCDEGRIAENREVPLKSIPPRCGCGALLRPDIVWFGEPLPLEALQQAVDFVEGCDVLLVAGTSAVVEPAASLPMMAKRQGAYVVEVNPEATPLSAAADTSIRGRAGEILPHLVGRGKVFSRGGATDQGDGG